MQAQLENKKRLLLICVLSFLLIAVVSGGVFLIRAPVLIVTDNSFYLLYGPARLRQKQIQISISLFRRVIPVIVSEHAGPDLVAIAAEEAASLPWAVLFPYRYLEGARRLRGINPDVRILVMGGRAKVPMGLDDMNIIYVQTDSAADLFRAGLSAAALAGEKNILVLEEELLAEEYRESLGETLKSHGFLGELHFRAPYEHISSYDNIGCAILVGSVFRFFDNNLDIPVILFSWLDPAFSPRSVKLVFDDSHWALAARALKSRGGAELLIYSASTVLADRIDEKGDSRKIRNLLRENS